MNLKANLSRPVKPMDLVLTACFFLLVGLTVAYGPRYYKDWQKRKAHDLWWQGVQKQSTNQCIELMFGLGIQAREAAGQLMASSDQITHQPLKAEDDFNRAFSGGKHNISFTFRQWCGLNENALSTLLSVVKGSLNDCLSRGGFSDETRRCFAAFESEVQKVIALYSSGLNGKATKGDVDSFDLAELDRTFDLLKQAIDRKYPQRKKGDVELRFEAMPKRADASEDARRLMSDLRAQADNGDARSQYELGQACASGRVGAVKDYVEAVRWYRKAAEQDYALAQNELGSCYAKGRGVAKDDGEAVKWYRKAADQNHCLAQQNLAVCYRNGEGVGKDSGEAVKWFRKAAEQNYAPAQYGLGLFYGTGEGVTQDSVEAVNWLGKAAEQDFAPAQCALGMAYDRGKGVAKDEALAVKWYLKAAEQNYSQAQNNLAWILATSGNPSIRDGSKAVVFAEKAVAATNRRSPIELDTLACAYAEAGQFWQAVVTEQEALGFPHAPEKRNQYEARLRLFEAKVPYHVKD